MRKNLTPKEREKKRLLKDERTREQAKRELLAMNNIKTYEKPKEKKKRKKINETPEPKLEKINIPKKKKRSKKENQALKEARERLKEAEKEYFQIGALHERKQKTSRRNSPNIKTRTTATKQRWKGWERRETPSEVVSYNLKDIQNNVPISQTQILR
ncbi:hypothetical protein FOA24_36815 [Bacillus thuringiensis]|uniref:hypothetical protein n=1 Tax=Bacillus thuringiensis TaxID=1428 RepID=UPI00333C8420